MRISDRHKPNRFDAQHDEARYEEARKRVAELRSFYVHALVYIVANTLLLANSTIGGHSLSSLSTLVGWGIGLAFHALYAYSLGAFGRRWEERKIQEYLHGQSRRSPQ